MSESNSSESSPHESSNSDGADSVASDNEPVLPAKRHRTQEQIRGKVWAFHGEITTDLLTANTDLPGFDDDDEDERS